MDTNVSQKILDGIDALTSAPGEFTHVVEQDRLIALVAEGIAEAVEAERESSRAALAELQERFDQYKQDVACSSAAERQIADGLRSELMAAIESARKGWCTLRAVAPAAGSSAAERAVDEALAELDAL